MGSDEAGTTTGGIAPRPALNRSIAALRAEFPGLVDGVTALDGAAGTLMPGAAIAAMAEGARLAMANVHGQFTSSEVSTHTVWSAREAVADLVGGVPAGVVLGPNTTTLTFHFANALARTWGSRDEVVVTSLDHDANVRPWVLAAERAGATVRWAELDVASGELEPAAFGELLSERTRLVAVTAASNAIGTKPDVRAIADRAHAVGALVYVDGGQATPHGPVELAALGADFYALSTYKAYGPHVGAVVADPALLEDIRPAALASATDAVPERFERGTPAFELLAGVVAAVNWIAGLTDAPGGRRKRVLASLRVVEAHLAELFERVRSDLGSLERVRILGNPRRRTPTMSFLIEGRAPEEVARLLARRRICVWAGDHGAYELMGRFGLRGLGGAVCAGVVLYNDRADVDRFLEAVAELAGR